MGFCNLVHFSHIQFYTAFSVPVILFFSSFLPLVVSVFLLACMPFHPNLLSLPAILPGNRKTGAVIRAGGCISSLLW